VDEMKQPNESENLGVLLRDASNHSVERQPKPYALQPLPDDYRKVQDRQQQMGRLEEVIRKKQTAPRTFPDRLFASLVSSIKGAVPHSDFAKTVDDLAAEYIRHAESLNVEVEPVIKHASGELKHITAYSDFVLSEFDRSKNKMYEANTRLGEAKAQAAKQSKKLSVITMQDVDFTETKRAYDNAMREASREENQREAYALRVNFRLLEREDVLTKEGIVRNTVAELEKVSTHTGMFVQNVHQLFGTETLLQALYATASAVRTSSGVLQELAHARSTISYCGTKGFVQQQEGAEYNFPSGILRNTVEQGAVANSLSQGSVFEDVHQRLAQPYFKQTVSPGPIDDGALTAPAYVVQDKPHLNGHHPKNQKARPHWKR
jgi:hypothetical protein